MDPPEGLPRSNARWALIVFGVRSGLPSLIRFVVRQSDVCKRSGLVRHTD
jgi:hypothetical protein